MNKILTTIEQKQKNIIEVATKLRTEISEKEKDDTAMIKQQIITRGSLQPKVTIIKDKNLMINKPDPIRRTPRITNRTIQNLDLDNTSSDDTDKENQESGNGKVRNIFKNIEKTNKTPVKKIFIGADKIISANSSKSTEMGRAMQPIIERGPEKADMSEDRARTPVEYIGEAGNERKKL